MYTQYIDHLHKFSSNHAQNQSTETIRKLILFQLFTINLIPQKDLAA